ncbi:CgeB family protein [Butyrivibrio sp. AE3004]|uniref:CgeB family protein n=1 Tax=Butyrivibrio sp. AE3004 TaxID=1506994 RepID=UPI000494033F|nr:glycosyltransferase [Butyrivibrio sp. AE3004]
MQNLSKKTAKIKSAINSHIASCIRPVQNTITDLGEKKLNIELPDTQRPLMALTFLPGSDISEDTLFRIKSRLSGLFDYSFITFSEKKVSFKTVNERILEAKADYIIFLNNVYDISKAFDKILFSVYSGNGSAGAVGARSYYSKKSGRTNSGLIKQLGLCTQKRFEKDGITPYLLLKENRNRKILWRSKASILEERIPSTDLLMMPFKEFEEHHGFFEMYDTEFSPYALSDICFLCEAKGLKNYLSASCTASVSFKTEKKKDARLLNRRIFRSRWYRYISSEKQASSANLDANSIDICGPMPENESAKFWGDYHYALAMKKSFEKQGFKVNILSREHWYDYTNSKYSIVLRGTRPYYRSAIDTGRIMMFWAISHPADITPEELNQADHVFFASEKMQEVFEPKIKTASSVLPQCTDPDVMFCSGSCSLSPELLFVGNSRHVYRRIIKDLIPTEHDLQIYGRHWEDFPEVQKHVVSDYIANSEVSSAYHNAAILLNDHWDDMLEYGIISNRIFDALCAGAFVISDNVPGIHELLGDAVVTYNDRDDLKNKVDYYLSHPDERNAIASMAQSLVKEKHSFDARIAEIIKVMSQTKV